MKAELREYFESIGINAKDILKLEERLKDRDLISLNNTKANFEILTKKMGYSRKEYCEILMNNAIITWDKIDPEIFNLMENELGLNIRNMKKINGIETLLAKGGFERIKGIVEILKNRLQLDGKELAKMKSIAVLLAQGNPKEIEEILNVLQNDLGLDIKEVRRMTGIGSILGQGSAEKIKLQIDLLCKKIDVSKNKIKNMGALATILAQASIDRVEKNIDVFEKRLGIKGKRLLSIQGIGTILAKGESEKINRIIDLLMRRLDMTEDEVLEFKGVGTILAQGEPNKINAIIDILEYRLDFEIEELKKLKSLSTIISQGKEDNIIENLNIFESYIGYPKEVIRELIKKSGKMITANPKEMKLILGILKGYGLEDKIIKCTSIFSKSSEAIVKMADLFIESNMDISVLPLSWLKTIKPDEMIKRIVMANRYVINYSDLNLESVDFYSEYPKLLKISKCISIEELKENEKKLYISILEEVTNMSKKNIETIYDLLDEKIIHKVSVELSKEEKLVTKIDGEPYSTLKMKRVEEYLVEKIDYCSEVGIIDIDINEDVSKAIETRAILYNKLVREENIENLKNGIIEYLDDEIEL